MNNNITIPFDPSSTPAANPSSPPSSPQQNSESAPPFSSDSSNSSYLSSQLRTLFHFQQLLSQQLHQARQDSHAGNQDGQNNNSDDLSVSVQILDQNVIRSNNEDNDNNGNNGNNRVVEESSSSSPPSAVVDLQMATRWVEQATAFVILLLILCLYQHRNGILIFLFNSVVFMNANQSLIKQVSLKDKRNPWVLGGVVFGLLGHIFFMYLFLHTDALWRSLLLIPPVEPIDIWTVFWIIVINDYFVRFVTMVVKACVILAVGHKSPHKRKGQLYTIIEMGSYTYRTFLPIPVWFHYFYTFDPNGQLFSSLMAGLYLACKFINMVDKLRQFLATLRAYLLREVQYGRYASGEQIAEVGDMCPICQEKMNSPIVLRCTHIFCEDCVSEWFERERTCPLCRAAVPTAGNRSHSDGSTSLLLQLF